MNNSELFDCDLVLVNYKTTYMCQKQLRSLNKLNFRNVIIVDNSFDYVAIGDETVIKPSKNLGFGSGVNIAINKSPSKYILCINPDLVIAVEEVAMALRSIKKSSVLALPKSEDSCFSTYYDESDSKIKKSKGQSNGFTGFEIVVINNERIRELGGFDEGIFMYAEDLDLIIRAIDAYGINAIQTLTLNYCHKSGGSYFGISGKIKRFIHSYTSLVYVMNKNRHHFRRPFFLEALRFSLPKYFS